MWKIFVFSVYVVNKCESILYRYKKSPNYFSINFDLNRILAYILQRSIVLFNQLVYLA